MNNEWEGCVTLLPFFPFNIITLEFYYQCRIMIDYFVIKTIFILILSSSSLCTEDLFLNKNCHEGILQKPHHQGSSWNKVINVHENELRNCQKKCGKKEIQETHCKQHEPEFVKDLGFQIVHDKCCDSKSCKCICSYKCETLKSKKQQLMVIFQF